MPIGLNMPILVTVDHVERGQVKELIAEFALLEVEGEPQRAQQEIQLTKPTRNTPVSMDFRLNVKQRRVKKKRNAMFVSNSFFQQLF